MNEENCAVCFKYSHIIGLEVSLEKITPSNFIAEIYLLRNSSLKTEIDKQPPTFISLKSLNLYRIWYI